MICVPETTQNTTSFKKIFGPSSEKKKKEKKKYQFEHDNRRSGGFVFCFLPLLPIVVKPWRTA